MKEPLLTVNHLRVQIRSGKNIIQPVDDVSFNIHQGEIYALVGESGCGKTMTALSVNRLLPENAYLCDKTQIYLKGLPLHQYSENEMRIVRSRHIGMIFQDPTLSLNPILTIGDQLREATQHQNNKKQILELLDKVRIPDPASIIQQYPHQLSGGMRQRIVIAMALAKSPDLLIADEPTTALDVTTQAQILELLKDINKQFKVGILLITHDMGIVAQMADTVAVMYAGHIVEKSSKETFIVNPKHPYTQLLFAALPEDVPSHTQLLAIPGQVPPLSKQFNLCRFRGRCPFVFKSCEEAAPSLVQLDDNSEVRCHWYDKIQLAKIPTQLTMPILKPAKIETVADHNTTEILAPENIDLALKDLKVYFPIRKGLFKKTVGYVKAVDGVTLNIYQGQTVALVGESGCGKTTVGKAIVRLLDASGEIIYQDTDLLTLSQRKLRKARSHFQIIFQDPYSSMDPRMHVSEIIEEGMLALKIGSDAKERQERINILLEQVGLSVDLKERFPHELSGGQRQRIAIARALAVGAELIVCDEPTSALDVSVQAQILNVLKSLQQDLNISYLFITHNIGVVKYISDFIAVMYLGRIVEYGPTQEVLNSPKHPYTKILLSSVPKITQTENHFSPIKGEIPSPSNPPKGCHFSPRCPNVHAPCWEKYPDNYNVGDNHTTRCYLYTGKTINTPIVLNYPQE